VCGSVVSNYRTITTILQNELVKMYIGTLYPQKLALTSPTSGGRSVGIVRSQTQTIEFSFSLVERYDRCVFTASKLVIRMTRNFHIYIKFGDTKLIRDISNKKRRCCLLNSYFSVKLIA
jgi:hypothetical protein